MIIQQQITQKLTEQLSPSVLKVINESAGHNVPKGSETHFKIIVISDQFAGKAWLFRHRLIYQILEEELKEQVHALSIHAYSEKEWETRAESVLNSPACLGGNSL